MRLRLPALCSHSSLLQPATQARQKNHRIADEKFTTSGAVSTHVNNVASMIDLLSSDSLLQWPTERENKVSGYTLVLTVICLTFPCALVFAMLVKSASGVHNYDLAAGRSRGAIVGAGCSGHQGHR
ncbi:hypothetical protein MTO96_010060 [Rhipicephalus appendiculatus]